MEEYTAGLRTTAGGSLLLSPELLKLVFYWCSARSIFSRHPPRRSFLTRSIIETYKNSLYVPDANSDMPYSSG